MKIFISYGHKDSIEFAKYLMNWLKDQGYNPWIDHEGIRIGDLYDFRIENAISDSNLMIAILSSWGLRPDGFCRRELLYARLKRIPILPIRLEDITPPIQIIDLHFEDAFPEWKRIEDCLPKSIIRITTTGESILRDWEATKKNSRWWNNYEKLNFTEELARHEKYFAGREWLFSKINKWVSDKEKTSKILFIIADTGVGKSAISAHLTNHLNVRSIHFCISSNSRSCKPHIWVQGIIYQLAAQFENYRKIIESKIEPKWDKVPAHEIFRTLIVEPLNECKNTLNIGENWIFVIDSLDESVALEGSKIIDLLTEIVDFIPSWIRIIISSRPDQNIIQRLSLSGVEHLYIRADDPDNLDDLKKYIERRFRLKEKDNNLIHKSGIVDKIIKISSGNFLYAEVLMDSLVHLNISADNYSNELNKFPNNLSGLYDRIFRKRFKDKSVYVQLIRPILCCLIASKEPLPRDLLINACRLNEKDANNGLLKLSQFLSSTKTEIRLFHHSLIEWLLDISRSTDFFVSKTEGQKLLAELCWSEYLRDQQQLHSYCRSYLPIHLAETERWDDLFQFVISNEMDLIKKWIEEGEGDTGIICLTGLIKYLSNQNIENIRICAFATQLGRIYSLRGDYINAESWFRKAKNDTSWLKGRRIKSISLHEMASISLYTRDFDKSKKYYKRALKLCYYGYPVYYDEVAANLIGLATIEIEKYNYNKSLIFTNRAIKKAVKAGDHLHTIGGERTKGLAIKALGLYKEAEEILRNAFKKCESYSAIREKYRILLSLGWLQHDQAILRNENTKQEISLFEEALEAAKNNYDYYYITEARMSLGWSYLSLNDERKAEQNFELAATRLIKGKHPELKAGVELGFTVLYHLRGEFNKAKGKYPDLIDLCKQYDIRTWHYKSLICLGTLYWYEKNYHEAETIWEEALTTAKNISQGKLILAKKGIEMSKQNPLRINL